MDPEQPILRPKINNRSTKILSRTYWHSSTHKRHFFSWTNPQKIESQLFTLPDPLLSPIRSCQLTGQEPEKHHEVALFSYNVIFRVRVFTPMHSNSFFQCRSDQDFFQNKMSYIFQYFVTSQAKASVSQSSSDATLITAIIGSTTNSFAVYRAPTPQMCQPPLP